MGAETYKINVIHAPNYGLDVIEFFHPSVNKWTALERLCRAYQIPREEVAAVGDDVNDIEMLSRAGLGVAMGNASDVTRAAADRVTLTNDQGGLAVVVDRLLSGRDLGRGRCA